MSKRWRWNGKQCRSWSDCSLWSCLIWVFTVCPDMSIQKLRIITILFTFNFSLLCCFPWLAPIQWFLLLHESAVWFAVYENMVWCQNILYAAWWRPGQCTLGTGKWVYYHSGKVLFHWCILNFWEQFLFITFSKEENFTKINDGKVYILNVNLWDKKESQESLRLQNLLYHWLTLKMKGCENGQVYYLTWAEGSQGELIV